MMRACSCGVSTTRMSGWIGKPISMSFAALPQHSAVRLCLTVRTSKYSGGFASILRPSLRVII